MILGSISAHLKMIIVCRVVRFFVLFEFFFVGQEVREDVQTMRLEALKGATGSPTYSASSIATDVRSGRMNSRRFMKGEGITTTGSCFESSKRPEDRYCIPARPLLPGKRIGRI